MAAELVAPLRADLGGHADPERAPTMQAYMKSSMPFLGVPVPMVRRLARAAVAANPPSTAAELERDVRDLWHHAEYREERYAAAALLDAPPTRGLRGPDQLALLRDLICDGAWWDHVDELSHRVGELLAGWPATVRAAVLGWAQDPDLWLRRSAIICQLGHKHRTDLDLLATAVEANATHRDFFVRKAIGWALRDYARTDPAWVREFIGAHELSPLSRREALKHL